VSERTAIAYKVLTAPEMAVLAADGAFAGSPVDLADGFIHLSTAEQVDETVTKHFAGQDALHIVAVDLAALGDGVRWEPSRGGALFPHVYGSLQLAACLAHGPLTRDGAGRVALPTG
jgi:uncharacterized protein (DUF952 family)